MKKTLDDKKKHKFKKKKTKKENTKRVAELQEFVQTLTLNLPLISSEDDSSSDSDSSSSLAVNRVQFQQPQAPQTRRERRANVYAEVSDTEVINSLNHTKMASIIKIKNLACKDTRLLFPLKELVVTK